MNLNLKIKNSNQNKVSSFQPIIQHHFASIINQAKRSISLEVIHKHLFAILANYYYQLLLVIHQLIALKYINFSFIEQIFQKKKHTHTTQTFLFKKTAAKNNLCIGNQGCFIEGVSLLFSSCFLIFIFVVDSTRIILVMFFSKFSN